MSRLHLGEDTTAKERLSSDKVLSVYGLVFGSRALQFDAFLKEAPSSKGLSGLADMLEKPVIKNAVFDLDGTLVAPYAEISAGVIEKLRDYLEDDRRVAIYTNSPHSDRLKVLENAGIRIAKTGRGKPSREGFKRLCDQCDMDPAHTAMVGNSPITDMPLVPDGNEPFFPLNVLVDSIPPQRDLIESRVKYFRAKVFHAISVAAAGVVKVRNPHMVRDVFEF